MNEKIIIPPVFKDKHVKAFFTTKSSGVALKDISRISSVPPDKIFMPIQKHTDKIALIESTLYPVIADAVITRETGIVIGVQVADCVPILLYESEKGIMGAVHAGWRGTAESILRKTVKTFVDRFSCSAENIFIAMGPAIRWCCYRVDFDVLSAVSRATGPGDYCITSVDKYCLDLPRANKSQALRSGVPEKNIWLSEECTFCNPVKYFSYRFARGTTGRQGAFIGRI
ncbi:MAG: peptidoglycan editing factor PgeF [Nitrospirota bacterium]|nr:peptidoglycan editing factor PgeF [Nitrospirota bacterium]